MFYGVIYLGLKPMIRERRMEKHMTQTELAEKLGISKSHMSLIEGGKHYPSPVMLWNIAKFCNCKVDELYTFTD